MTAETESECVRVFASKEYLDAHKADLHYDGYARTIVLRAASASPVPTAECVWTIDEFGDPDFYETSCGQTFAFIDGTASDNGVKFCHYCGKPMREVKANTDETDDEDDGNIDTVADLKIESYHGR